jgi:hypothetical protein
MNLKLKKRIDGITNKDVILLYFDYLKRLLIDLELSNEDPRISLTTANGKGRLFSFNLNSRLAFSITNGFDFMFLIKDEDVKSIEKLYTCDFSDPFVYQKPDARLVTIPYSELLKDKTSIYSFILKCCNEYKDNQDGSQYRHYHIPEMYACTMKPEILEHYISSNVQIARLIENYKKYLKKNGIKEELYKWELIQQFKSRPDLKAPDFDKEINEIDYSNLIYHNGASVAKQLAKEKPEGYRKAFSTLFDEGVALTDRVSNFEKQITNLYHEINKDAALSHHHDERTIATFLTYHNPNQYTFYKSSYYKKYCELLQLKPKGKGEKYVHYLELIGDLIKDYITNDSELLTLVQGNLIGDLFTDENHFILAQDILYMNLEKGIDENSRRYWRIGTSDDDTSYLDEMIAENKTCIGWSNLGDLSTLNISSKNDLIQKLANSGYKPDDKRTRSRKAGEIYNFFKEITEDDIILAQDGFDIKGIGIVTGGYFLDSKSDFAHSLPIEWLTSEVNFKNKQGIQTSVFEITDKTVIKEVNTLLDNDKSQSEQEPNYWVFQANPSIYDLEAALKENVLEAWTVNQYAKDVKNGDKAIIRLGGSNIGVYALATITSNVHKIDVLENELKFYAKPEDAKSSNAVLLQLDYNLVNHPFGKNQMEFIKLDGGRAGTNFKATQEQYDQILSYYQKTKNMNATNKILYGPPGTGKTYKLKEEYFPLYTTLQSNLTPQENFENVVKDLTWWQVIAVALVELKQAKVFELMEHQWLKYKAENSNSKNVRATIWGNLQFHTSEKCENVKYARRQDPLIFLKDEDSYWSLDEEIAKELAPEIYDLFDSVNNFKPEANKEIKRYEFTTFHQSFAYEDFIEGIKPLISEDELNQDLAYQIEDGVFKQICRDADNDPKNRYAIFIDEINRGNVSAIFGELITLIEPDKRKGAKNEMWATLPYSKKPFSIPQNLDIYGTMNTADRSVEALDTALRRRFSFEEMMPKYDLPELGNVFGFPLGEVLKTINERIEILIDRDHTIGHSYFLGVQDENALRLAFKDKIIPLLQEYFYGDYGKIGLVLGDGFVQAHEKQKDVFTAFKYEGKSDLNRSFYELKDVSSINLEEALRLLMNKENA